MRKSFHTLCGLVRNKIGGDPMNGDVYIFVNKRRNRIKLLHYALLLLLGSIMALWNLLVFLFLLFFLVLWRSAALSFC